jgi:hypothetical protein
MLREQLAAQDRLFGQLGIGREELDEIQKERKFNAVADLVRSGNKRDAVSLFWENMGAAGSFGAVVKTAARLAVPQALFQWNRQRKQREAIAKYGKLG